VRLPGARYWTALDEDLAVLDVADSFLRQVRSGRDGAQATTKSYAHSIALFLRWCPPDRADMAGGDRDVHDLVGASGPCSVGTGGTTANLGRSPLGVLQMLQVRRWQCSE
jgi:integrase/recombinase XerD